MGNDIIAVLFIKWRDTVTIRKYNEWCEINNDRLVDEEDAAREGMDSIYWCWNCIHSDCPIH